MRVMIIKNNEGQITQDFEELKERYGKETMTDSQALHLFLCEEDPGENYTVEFKNI